MSQKQALHQTELERNRQQAQKLAEGTRALQESAEARKVDKAFYAREMDRLRGEIAKQEALHRSGREKNRELSDALESAKEQLSQLQGKPQLQQRISAQRL